MKLLLFIAYIMHPLPLRSCLV